MGEICSRSDPDIAQMKYSIDPLKLIFPAREWPVVENREIFLLRKFPVLTDTDIRYLQKIRYISVIQYTIPTDSLRQTTRNETLAYLSIFIYRLRIWDDNDYHVIIRKCARGWDSRIIQ